MPGQVHSRNFEGEVDANVVHFSPSFFESFLSKNGYLDQFPFFSGMIDDAVIRIDPLTRQKIIGLFEDIVAESEKSDRMSLDLIRSILLQVFILLSRANSEKKQALSYNYTLVKTFQKLIENNFGTLKLARGSAELLYETPNYLNAICNDLLRLSAGEVIRIRVLLEAKRLLINLNLTIAAIGYQLSFSDNSYFPKFFRKYTASTPEEFRKISLNHK